jgi:uncharacterized membrane protein
MRTSHLKLVLVFLAGSAMAAALAAQSLYRVTDLGRLPGFTYMTYPLAVNNRGEVVGLAYGTATYQAFVWDKTNGLRALPPVPGEEDRSSTAVGINDLGEIIGYSGQAGGTHMVGWLYRNGEYTMLGTIPGYDGSLPAAINNHTEIVGSATGWDSLAPYTNFYWSPATGMINVVPGGETEFYDINDAGVITGGVRSGAVPAPGITTWDMRSGFVIDLGSLPDSQLSFGYSINESGVVAGDSIYISTGGHRTAHAVFASIEIGVKDLALYQALATAINERGEIVGSRAFASNNTYYSWLFSDALGLIPDLRAVVEDAAYYGRISDARDINDLGQIVAIGDNGHFPGDLSRRGFLLTPFLFDDGFESGSTGAWSLAFE